ncbi:MAG: DUF2125 domain-containing protein [Phenylobacterium sp.]
MSLPDRDLPRKANRLGLYIPFGLALLLIVGWTAAWLWMRGEARERLETTASELRRAGYEVSWKRLGIGGYPFRLNLSLSEPRIREPSGWALQAPTLEAQAPAYAPGEWLLAAPEGLTFVRPIGGPVAVKGRLLRASLADPAAHPPSLSVEGADLTFAPAAGAQPFALSAAKAFELHLRAMPEDQGVIRFKVDNGKARLAGLFARIAGDKPVSMVFEGVFSEASAFAGRDWASAVRAWTDGGGQMSVRQAGVTAGQAVLGAQSGTLTVGADGRLRGSIDASLRQAPMALGAMGQAGVIPPESAAAASAVAQARQTGDVARATLTFEAGQTTLGPVAIGPAPRVY